MRLKLKQQLLRRQERELKLRKDFYSLEEAAKKLGISVATVWKYLTDTSASSLHIERYVEGPRQKRLITANDIRKIWWQRHTVIVGPRKKKEKFTEYVYAYQ